MLVFWREASTGGALYIIRLARPLAAAFHHMFPRNRMATSATAVTAIAIRPRRRNGAEAAAPGFNSTLARRGAKNGDHAGHQQEHQGHEQAFRWSSAF